MVPERLEERDMTMAKGMARGGTMRKVRRNGGRRNDAAARNGAARVWNAMVLTVMVVAVTGVLIFAVGETMHVGASAMRTVGGWLGFHEAAAGERAGWWGAPLLLVGAVLGIEVLWKIGQWLLWTPGAGGDTDRRHPLMRRSTWGGIAVFGLLVALPVVMEAGMMANSPRPTYEDAREGLVSIRRRCPALAGEIDALIAKGVPTTQQVASMRVRAKVVTASPLKGQDCRYGAAS